MPQFIPIETLFESTFWNIGALSAILELNEYVEPLFFLAGRELTQHRPKKGYCIHPQQSRASKSMARGKLINSFGSGYGYFLRIMIRSEDIRIQVQNVCTILDIGFVTAFFKKN